MIVLVPVNEDRQSVCPSFGRAPYFYIADSCGENPTIAENPAANSESGAGVRAAQAAIDLHAEVVVTPRLGENAANVLKAAGIGLFRPESDDARTNVGAMLAGTLEPLTAIHPGFHAGNDA